MKKITSAIAYFLVFGLTLVTIAVFAEVIGLDKNPGNWSRARIAVFVMGVLFVGLAGFYYKFNQRIGTLVLRVRSSFQRQPLVNWLSNNKAIQYSLRLAHRYAFTILIPITILMVYAWLASSGTWTTWKSPTYYYSSLAEAFLDGNLNLSIHPDPKLLVLENPYDASNRTGIEIPADLSLYNGKFYMYWGPAPTLLLTIIQLFVHAQIGDLFLTFAFACGIFLSQSALLYAIWNRYFSTMPKEIIHLSILLVGFTGPIILLRHNYDNARIYEASIAGGQFFMMCGLWMTFTALIKPNVPNYRLVMVGIFWALAIGTRQIFAAPIGFMVFLVGYWLVKLNTSLIIRTKKLVALALPLTLGFISLGWYNWARFGSIAETGLYYQLSEPYIRGFYNELFSPTYIIQNLYNYLVNPPEFTSNFPFVFMARGSVTSFLPFYTVPKYYNAQPMTGLIFIFPFIVFAVTPLILSFSNLIKNKRLIIFSNNLDHKLLNWFALNLGIACLIAFCLLLGFFWAGMRYTGDFIPVLTILSALGFWQGYYQFPAHKSLSKKLYLLSGCMLGALSIIVSILLAISINSKLVNIIFESLPFLG